MAEARQALVFILSLLPSVGGGETPNTGVEMESASQASRVSGEALFQRQTDAAGFSKFSGVRAGRSNSIRDLPYGRLSNFIRFSSR